METCLLVGRQPRSVSQTVKSIHKSGHRSDRRNALGSKGRNRSLTHRPARETGESSLLSLPGTLWGERRTSVPEPLPGGAWAHVDTPARGSVSPHRASRALKGRLPWWGALAPALADPHHPLGSTCSPAHASHPGWLWAPRTRPHPAPPFVDGQQAACTCQLPVLPADPTVMLRPQHLHLGRSRVEPPPDRPRPVAPREKARSVSPPKDPERHTGRAQRTEWPSSSPHVSSVPQAQSKEVQVKTSDTGQEAELFPVPLKQSTLC